MSERITVHTGLEVYRKAFDAAMCIHELSRSSPKVETYSLTDQIRRSSRSVCANMPEAWRKQRYEKAFISKLCDAEGECAETQAWLEFATKCGYIEPDQARDLYRIHHAIFATSVGMITHTDSWTLPKR